MNKSGEKHKVIHLNEEQLRDIIKEVLLRLYEIDEDYLYKDVFVEMNNRGIITEGLIMTYPPRQTINMLKTFGAAKYGITGGNWPNRYGGCALNIGFSKGLSLIGVDNFLELIGRMDTYGWYVALITNTNIKLKDISDESIEILEKQDHFSIIFEPKFDVEVNNTDLPQKFYHITKIKYIDKIKRNGLTPRNKDKVTHHPERVYLLRDKPSNWRDIGGFYNEIEQEKENYCILEIDGNMLNKSNTIYYDPNSNIYEAYYTLEPIPPYAIKINEQ